MEALKEVEVLKPEEVAPILKIPVYTLRKGLQQRIYPFGVAIMVDKQYSYFIYKIRLEKYLNGEL